MDWDAAYQQLHLHATVAAQSMCMVPHPQVLDMMVTLSFLHPTFCGNACPTEWCAFAEMITDLANNLVEYPGWKAHV